MLNSIRTIKIKDAHAAAILEQLKQMKALEFLDTENDFILSPKQLALLEKRSKTPIENCIPANTFIKNVKKKYGV